MEDLSRELLTDISEREIEIVRLFDELVNMKFLRMKYSKVYKNEDKYMEERREKYFDEIVAKKEKFYALSLLIEDLISKHSNIVFSHTYHLSFSDILKQKQDMLFPKSLEQARDDVRDSMKVLTDKFYKLEEAKLLAENATGKDDYYMSTLLYKIRREEFRAFESKIDILLDYISNFF